MNKLASLRTLMKNAKLDGYFIPHNDAHNSEYIAECDERLAFISGFTGSSGIGLVLENSAYLWTDSRYYIQAQKQLPQGWEMKKLEEMPWFQFVSDNHKNVTIGFDPKLLPYQNAETRIDFFNKNTIKFSPLENNLIDQVWTDKPQMPEHKIFLHEAEFCGDSTQVKLNKVKSKVQAQNQSYLLTSKLDEIAWVLNLRGTDITYNPVFMSYLYLDFTQNDNKGILFIDKTKIDQQVQEYLIQNHIEVYPYESIDSFVQKLDHKVIISKNNLNYHIAHSFKSQDNFLASADNLIDLIKEVKTQREIEGMRECHIYDGVALVRYLAWLNDQVNIKKNKVNEFEAANQAELFRKQQKYNMGLSFDTISSTGANAAIVHYKPTETDCAQVDPNHIYLCDSGGQYKCGTTDVTRTVHMRTPTDEEKDAYTRVLLGNLDIERLLWPKKNKISGSDMDILARRRLWSNYMDYGHGTGHGVGYFLNVHEGPNGISKYRYSPMEHGNIVSNEPGFYKEGSFGIRIENLILCKENQNKDFLCFENLTMCPYDKGLIDVNMLQKDERQYLNEYHALVYKNLAHLIEEQKDEVAMEWLKNMTQPI